MNVPPIGPQRNPTLDEEGQYLADELRFNEDSLNWSSFLFFERYEMWQDKKRRQQEFAWWD